MKLKTNPQLIPPKTARLRDPVSWLTSLLLLGCLFFFFACNSSSEESTSATVDSSKTSTPTTNTTQNEQAKSNFSLILTQYFQQSIQNGSSSLQVSAAGHQYYGQALGQSLGDGTNNIALTISPVIGDVTVSLSQVGRIADLKFQYDPLDFANLSDPKLGVILNNASEEIFDINPSTGLTDGYASIDVFAVVGVEVKDADGRPVAGAEVFVDRVSKGLTGSGSFGTSGYLKVSLIRGTYQLRAEDGQSYGEQSLNLEGMDIKNIDITLVNPLAPESIATGGYHTCALWKDASVKCWGYNPHGQLGLGDTNHRGDASGEMGDSLPAINLGTNRTAQQLFPGVYHTCALLDNNSLKCWGQNENGQLGLGDTNHRGDASGEMGDSLPAIDLCSNRSVLQVAGGNSHTCAILDMTSDTRELKCWGDNTYGGLGLGDTTQRGDNSGEMGENLPVVDLGSNLIALQIKAGYNHTIVMVALALVIPPTVEIIQGKWVILFPQWT